MSQDQARREVVLQAKIQALKNAFGEVVIQGNATYLQASSERNETKELYTMVSDSYVNGEWVKNKKEDVITTFISNNDIWIKASVDGYGQALPKNDLTMSIACGNPQIGFYENNVILPEFADVKVKFNSNQAGYLYIFMDDPSTESCSLIFPLDSAVTGSKAHNYMPYNTPVTLFDSNSHYAPYEITSYKAPGVLQEVVKLYFLFTPNKPLILPQSSIFGSQHSVQTDDYKILPFDSLPMEEYQRWLHTLRSSNSELQYTWLTLTIK
jgi:hypothetical protein